MFKWFEALFGFEEYALKVRADLPNYLKTQACFDLKHSSGNVVLKSKVNGRAFDVGAADRDMVVVEHRVINCASRVHFENPGSTVQAASQFNCLEMANPVATPELGVTQYSTDRTQGPACALACSAGTVFRNYFVLVDDKGRLRSQQSDSSGEDGVVLGQRAGQQLNTLRDLEDLLDNDKHEFFSIKNGYTNGSDNSVGRLYERLKSLDESEADALRVAVRVGLHADVGITFEGTNFKEVPAQPSLRVSQVYASALSCAYSGVRNELWEPLACLVLQAAYEATLLAGCLNYANDLDCGASKAAVTDEDAAPAAAAPAPESVFPSLAGSSNNNSKSSSNNNDNNISDNNINSSSSSSSSSSNDNNISNNHNNIKSSSFRPSQKVFLTALGGGVFGNDKKWIADAIGRAVALIAARGIPLLVVVCHFRQIDAAFQQLVDTACAREMERERGRKK